MGELIHGQSLVLVINKPVINRKMNMYFNNTLGLCYIKTKTNRQCIVCCLLRFVKLLFSSAFKTFQYITCLVVAIWNCLSGIM